MRLSSPHPQLHLERGCVVSYCANASAAGNSVLRQGGNAVDAAVATAFALAVTYPQGGNIGGGGFLLWHKPGDAVRFLDYREVAPAGIALEQFLDREGQPVHERLLLGALACGVPGTVAGLHEAHARGGRLGWDRVLAPAIDLAARGFRLTTRQAGYIEVHSAQLSRFESTRAVYLPGGHTPLPGTLWVQPALAATLRRLADEGPGDFYRGRIAAQIVDEVRRGGGVLSAEDLDAYRPLWRAPLARDFAGRRVFSAALPSGGGLVLLVALGLLDAERVGDVPLGSPARATLMARALRVAFTERLRRAADPALLDESELAALAARAAETFAPGELAACERALRPGIPGEDARALRANTTHFCVVDGEGGAVSNTFSLNTMFGNKLVVGGAGFLLNNCLDDFCLPGVANWYELEQGERDHLRPGARPVSSMSPMLALRDGAIELVAGGSGGPRIPTMLTQLATWMLVDNVPVDEAVRLPRLHHQAVPEEIAVEERMPAPIVEALAAHFPKLAKAPLLGMSAAIHVRDNRITAALDPRFSVE